MVSYPVKKLVRHKNSGRYYAARGRWVDRVDAAKSFDSTMEVLEEMGRGAWERGCCELVLKFDGVEGMDTGWIRG